MATKDSRIKKPFIDISGPDDNVYAILANSYTILVSARHYSRQLGHSEEKMNIILQEMKSGDYENLLMVFKEHYGDYVDIVR